MASNSPQTSNPDRPPVIYRSDDTVTDDEDRQLRALFFSSFSYNPIFLARRYLKRRPGHRWMIKTESGEIVGHAALHERVVGTETGDLRVGGVAEVCVAAPHRGLGITKQLLRSIDQWSKAQDIGYGMLFGEPKIYASSGYVPIQNELRVENWWGRRWNPFHGKAMVKAHTPNPWPRGMIDLRGPTF